MKTIERVREQLEALGVKAGGVLLVHTSFRAVRPIEGGPEGLIVALRGALGPAGTLVMPAMTDGESPFDPTTTPTSVMGITAEVFWRQKGVLRSTHPGGSFAAAGPLAEAICAPQPLAPPHGEDSPPGRVVALDGQVLLLGVDHSESTVLHVAEAIARVPYSVRHPCIVMVEGVPQSIMIPETDHCCMGFRKVGSWLLDAGLQSEGKVGNASAKLVRAKDAVAISFEHLARDPFVFLCKPKERCDECDEARASAHA